MKKSEKMSLFEDMPINELPLAILDLETTGFKPPEAKITEVAIICPNSSPEEVFHSLVDPEVRIPAEITALTGITNSMVKGKPKIGQLAEKIAEILEGKIFVAHNVPFDLAFISHLFSSVLDRELQIPSLCTLRLSRKFFALPSNSLGAVAKHFNIQTVGAHRAMADTLTVKLLMPVFIERLDREGYKNGGDLIRAKLIKT
ncbi:MAG: 3'-5' exonuclease [Candidatus Riflebacteria bacterium]|nr:3'-5' exonuclease [Candidatus Riflebacteria bacterium]